MFVWLEALVIAVSASILMIIIVFVYILIRRRFTFRQQAIVTVTNHDEQVTVERTKSIEDVKTVSSKRPSYNVFRRGSSSRKSIFNWADHPALITDVIENGWSRFAFINYHVAPSVRSSSMFSSLRDNNFNNNNTQWVDMSWEIGQEGTTDYMQKIRFNKLINGPNSDAVEVSHGREKGALRSSTFKMALPLPGPRWSFPQEAYFEITVLSSKAHDVNNSGGGEGEKVKLIQSNSWSESLGHVTSGSSGAGAHLFEEIKIGSGGRRKRRGGEDGVKLSLGLTVGGEETGNDKIPGSYSGSIGFNSNGSVYLGGMKLVFESEKEDWAQPQKVIGCGFDPQQKRVLFTVESKLVHAIHCKSEEFGMPLYPIITASIDITILVNLGQTHFSYSPANAHRTPKPCFIGPTVCSPTTALWKKDSRELFSMERIDVEWLHRNARIVSTISNNSNPNDSNNSNITMIDYDEESEADLFEIVLDKTSS